MSMEEHIHFIRWVCRRNVHQTEAKPVALQVDDQRPIEVAVTIPAHQGDRWPEAFQPNEKTWSTQIAKMPDLVDSFGQRFQILRQMIMGIGEDKHAQRRHSQFLHQPEKGNKSESAGNLSASLCVGKSEALG